MDYSKENQNWDSLSYVEKNHQLYLKQKALLDQFLEKGAISQAQHDKSLHDLIEKMDKKEYYEEEMYTELTEEEAEDLFITNNRMTPAKRNLL